MQDFKELRVWQKAHELVLDVYRLTAGFPQDERFGLVSQMRRAAVSIPANIAEGRCRRGDKDFARFVQMAMGSAAEVEYFLLLACDLGYIAADRHAELDARIREVKRMLSGFLERLSGGTAADG
ncbi:MAG: four helix bundle protein [Planctomycetota bacterium]